MTPPPQPAAGRPGPVSYPGQARPSGGTAITAAVLALVKFLIGGYFFARGLSNARFSNLSTWVSFSLQIPMLLLLLVGAIFVFARVKAGAILLLTGAALSLLTVGVIAALTGGTSLNYGRLLAYAPLTGALNLLSPVLTVLVLVLAVLPSTRRYLAAARQPAYPGPPVPYGYPPSQGYGPPPHPGQHPPQQW
ncbi:hypothetical protein [Amycolatopsis sp. NPDC059021]|uniref:hypothetical protein n=1 Tax=Amycolatopsis sp. NPDC059021 TaxID=3346704 RepID=UPI00366E8F86